MPPKPPKFKYRKSKMEVINQAFLTARDTLNALFSDRVFDPNKRRMVASEIFHATHEALKSTTRANAVRVHGPTDNKNYDERHDLQHQAVGYLTDVHTELKLGYLLDAIEHRQLTVLDGIVCAQKTRVLDWMRSDDIRFGKVNLDQTKPNLDGRSPVEVPPEYQEEHVSHLRDDLRPSTEMDELKM